MPPAPTVVAAFMQEVFEDHLHLREQHQLEEDIVSQMIHYHVQHND